MWIRNNGNGFFEKRLLTENFDSNSVLIVAGVTNGKPSSSESFFTKQGCHIPNLPLYYKNSGHTLLLSVGDHKALSCGGDETNYNDICLEMNAQTGQWTFHRYDILLKTFSIILF